MDKSHNFYNNGSGIMRNSFSGSSFSTAGRKSMYASPQPFNRAGNHSISGRSTHSIMGIHSEFNIVESFGLQLPVLVNEILTFNEKNQIITIESSENGWAWIVQGRRLLVWQYKIVRADGGSPTRETGTTLRRGGPKIQCRELIMPHCDIGHKASLVSVYVNDVQKMPSCIAATPTGDIRYWPSIAHDNLTVDLLGILDGQEFETLIEVVKGRKYIIVTTTCSLILLQMNLVNGRTSLQYKNIKQPSGFLSGISKRLSIFMGAPTTNEKESKFVGVVGEKNEDGDSIISVLSDRSIQRWLLTSKKDVSTEQYLYDDVDILRKIREEFQIKFWNSRVENSDINIHLLDMHFLDDKLYILGGAVNMTHTPQMYYGVATLTPTAEVICPVNFIPLKFTQFFSPETQKECLSLKFIISRTHLYFYTDKIIYPINLSSPNSADLESDKIEFHKDDDMILHAKLSAHIPIFFSRVHGMVSVTPGDFENLDMTSPANEMESFIPTSFIDNTVGAINENNLHVFAMDADAILNEFKDEVSQVKAAFIYRLKRNNNTCNAILNDLLQALNENQTNANENNKLDIIIVTIAQDLAEDIPAADPRWEEVWNDKDNNKCGIGSSSSLQILTQLKEKNLALRHFVEFLHSTAIWEKLSTYTIPGINAKRSTSLVISDINEKIIAAIALRTIQKKYQRIIDEAISVVVRNWPESPNGNLTAQDLFYVKICKFTDIFPILIEIIENRNKKQLPTDVLICDVNTIILHIITEIQSFREDNNDLYMLPLDKIDLYDYLPWTAMGGNIGLRDTLTHLVDLTIRYGVHCAHDAELKQRAYQQILELIDFILFSKKTYIDSVRETEKYGVLFQQFESQRQNLIAILIEEEQYEYAVKLAEKYLDFHSLIYVCDLTKNEERLDTYIKEYEDYNFSQYAINWHLRQNRQGDVFTRFKSNQAALSQFMRDHPTLGWIQLIFNGDFERAAKLLFKLAQSETEYVERKKSILSLAKLSAFTSADSDLTMQIENINAELSVIEYQMNLNEELLESLGYDIDNPKVLRIEEIIHLFISEENDTANEFDFRKAIELLNYMEDPYEARIKIWCASILRDDWINYDADTATDYLQNLLFFKLVEVCHLMDGDIENFLPHMEEFLTSDDLSDLTKNKSFEYLLKLAYEYISDTFKKVDEDEEMI